MIIQGGMRMKKKRLYNRIGCAVIALVMILSLGLSPLMTMETSAEGEGLTIEVLEDTPTKFEETGEPIDMSQYFTACYDGAEVYGMYDSRNSDEYWFESGNFAETMNNSTLMLVVNKPLMHHLSQEVTL